MKTLLFVASLLLFGASFLIHGMSLLGIPVIRETGAISLHVGMLLMGLISAILIQEPAYGYRGNIKEFWRKYAPSWLHGAWLVLLVYAVLTIGWAGIFRATIKPKDELHSRAVAIQIFSSGWMLFYSISVGVLYAVLQHRKESAACEAESLLRVPGTGAKRRTGKWRGRLMKKGK
jgi:hypothetical protein